jgi:hypothetical protein
MKENNLQDSITLPFFEGSTHSLGEEATTEALGEEHPTTTDGENPTSASASSYGGPFGAY